MKITRKEIRRMLEAQVIKEQATSSGGPFLVMIVDSDRDEVSIAFIIKSMPPANWWHAYPGGLGLPENEVVNIIDMSAKKVIQAGGPYKIAHVQFQDHGQVIRHPEAD